MGKIRGWTPTSSWRGVAHMLDTGGLLQEYGETLNTPDGVTYLRSDASHAVTRKEVHGLTPLSCGQFSQPPLPRMRQKQGQKIRTEIPR